jgi:polyisoprenoid-binding protein YceI
MSTSHQVTPTAAVRWRLDPAASSAEFRVAHFWGLITVKGHFEDLDGWLEFDPDGTGALELAIDAASVNTGNHKRDTHLHSTDFFDTERNPEVRFRATSVSTPAEDRLSVTGELHAAGHRVPLTLQPVLRDTGNRLQIEATASVDQRQLGLTWSPLGMVRTPVALRVRAELRRDE